jgi:hypothetical protein
MRILVDKSAWQGISTDEIQRLCKAHDVFFPEVIFYELLTTPDPITRAALFRKLTPELSIRAIPNAGYLLGQELDSGLPWSDDLIHDLRDFTWVFRQQLRSEDPDLRLPQLPEWIAHTAERVRNFRFRADRIGIELFPELEEIRPGQMLQIEPRLEELRGDSTLVKQIARERLMLPIEAEDFGPRWAAYRYLQASLIWSLDHIGRYGSGRYEAVVNGIENTYCDAEYGALACFFEVFLTRDTRLGDLVQRMGGEVRCIGYTQEL